MATRPSKCSNRCILAGLEIPISVCFSTILNDRKGINETKKTQTNTIIVTPVWQNQSWYPILLGMTIKNPILLPNHPKVLLSQERKIHPLIQNSSLRLVEWLVTGKIFLQKGYQKGLSTIYPKNGKIQPTKISKANKPL